MFKDTRNLGSNAFQDFRGGGGNQAKFLRGRIIMIQKSGAIIRPMFDKNMTHNSARMMKTMHIILQGKEHFSINKKILEDFSQNGVLTGSMCRGTMEEEGQQVSKLLLGRRKTT